MAGFMTEDGKCLEQPYEQAEDPDSTFKDRIRMPAYPVEELGGLIFAYLGPQPAPLLPRWELFVRDGVLRDIGAAVIPCNWLQIMENSLDPVHVEWLHQHFFNYVQERLGRTEFKGNPVSHKKINFREFEHGIIKTRMLEGRERRQRRLAGGPSGAVSEYSFERQHEPADVSNPRAARRHAHAAPLVHLLSARRCARGRRR